MGQDQQPGRDDQWYYDLPTRQVTRGKVHGATRRMGPYPTAEEAAAAMERAAARNEEWRQDDATWND